MVGGITERGRISRECAIRFRGEVLRGSIELDPEARAWEYHGHAENPVYEDVVLHLFFRSDTTEFFTRTASHRLVPQVLLSDKISTTGVPTPQPAAKPGRCSLRLTDWPLGQITSLFEAAARYRLELKTARWNRVIQAHGWDQAVFQGLAETLGYANNKLPMTVLAQRLPLAQLQKRPDEAGSTVLRSFGIPRWIQFRPSGYGHEILSTHALGKLVETSHRVPRSTHPARVGLACQCGAAHESSATSGGCAE